MLARCAHPPPLKSGAGRGSRGSSTRAATCSALSSLETPPTLNVEPPTWPVWPGAFAARCARPRLQRKASGGKARARPADPPAYRDRTRADGDPAQTARSTPRCPSSSPANQRRRRQPGPTAKDRGRGLPVPRAPAPANPGLTSAEHAPRTHLVSTRISVTRLARVSAWRHRGPPSMSMRALRTAGRSSFDRETVQSPGGGSPTDAGHGTARATVGTTGEPRCSRDCRRPRRCSCKRTPPRPCSPPSPSTRDGTVA